LIKFDYWPVQPRSAITEHDRPTAWSKELMLWLVKDAINLAAYAVINPFTLILISKNWL
jgi:hypothetical protein